MRLPRLSCDRSRGNRTQLDFAGGENAVLQKVPRDAADKRKAIGLDLGGSMEPATRHPAPGPLSVLVPARAK
jgi:hypothetical protein